MVRTTSSANLRRGGKWQRFLLVALLLPSACSSRSGGSSATPGPTVEVPGLEALAHRPLIVVGEWMPIFALYEDGLVIYHRGEFRRGEELYANLGRAGALALAREIAEMGFFELPLHERASYATDQPTVSILLRDGVRWHRASVYGYLRHHDGPAATCLEATNRL